MNSELDLSELNIKSEIHLIRNRELNDFVGGVSKKVLFTITGPSAVGKDTIVDILLKNYPETFVKPISFTTRIKRLNELDGVNYYFISKEEFETLKSNGKIFESTEFNKNYYGYTIAEIDRIYVTGRAPLCVVDNYGMRHMDMSGRENGLSVFKSFILPPNAFELKKRLITRDCKHGSIRDCELNRSEAFKRFKMGNNMIRCALYGGGYNSFIVNNDSKETAKQVAELFILIINGTLDINSSLNPTTFKKSQ